MKNNNFKKMSSTIKGEIGQDILIKKFTERFPQYKLYPCAHDNIGRHNFDGLILNKVGDLVAYYDVKTKPRRYKYDDTGIDYYSYLNYRKISLNKNKPFYLFFVDQLTKEIYYNSLDKLIKSLVVRNKQYPSIESNFNSQIIYFPLINMKLLCCLNDAEVDVLTQKTRMSQINKNGYLNQIKTVSQIIDG